MSDGWLREEKVSKYVSTSIKFKGCPICGKPLYVRIEGNFVVDEKCSAGCYGNIWELKNSEFMLDW